MASRRISCGMNGWYTKATLEYLFYANEWRNARNNDCFREDLKDDVLCASYRRDVLLLATMTMTAFIVLSSSRTNESLLIDMK